MEEQKQYQLYRYTPKGGGDFVAVTLSQEIAEWWKGHGTVDGIKHAYQSTPDFSRRDDLPCVVSVSELATEVVAKIEGDLSWLERFPNGRLLEQVRNVPEMEKLWKEYCHFDGCHSRPNGSRERLRPSPLCGSLIQLSDTSQTVMIHQTECGKGPLQLWVYTNGYFPGGSKDASVYLVTEVLKIIDKYRFPWVGFGGAN